MFRPDAGLGRQLSRRTPWRLRGGLEQNVVRADTWSMSVSAITASGRDLLATADRRLAESARTLTRAATEAPTATDAASGQASGGDDVVDAAVGVIYGRTAFEIGLRLIAVGRDTEKSLVDIIA